MSFIEIDRASARPLTSQIYARLRDRILTGSLPPGQRLSSTRRMAQDLGVSRNIVMNAFDQLLAEGYIETRTGAGSFVAPGASFAPARPPRREKKGRPAFGPVPRHRIDFRSGLPDLDAFPVGTWQRLSRSVWEGLSPRDLSYGQPEGRAELREQIARYIAVYRGVGCDPEQIIVTAGTTQAVGIIARLLVRDGRTACLLEDPLTSDIRSIIADRGGRIVPVAVDDQGMRVEELPHAGRPALLYVTPSHQFPLGGTMPIQRRVRLIDYARSRGTFVVEDDYDSEFRYDSPPVAAIQGLDPSRVIYVGTFSKTLCPGLRLGYMVLPPGLVDRGRRTKWFTDLHNSSPDQMVMARFMAEGHFVRYVHRMKKTYQSRRQVLVRVLARHFGERVRVLGSAAGIHLCARFDGVRFDDPLRRAIARRGVGVYSVEEHAVRAGRYEDTLILGFGMLLPRQIEEGIAALAAALPALSGGPPRERR